VDGVLATDNLDDLPTREVMDMILIEVSPTALPAYPQTSIAVRGLALRIADLRRQLDAAMARG
jgi:phage head maturation protease